MSPGQAYPDYSLQWRISSLRIGELFQLRLANAKSKRRVSSRKRVRVIPPRLLSSILIILGALALFFSVIYTLLILAFIGLGLLFFGVTFTYVRSDEYVKKILLDATVSSQQATLKHIIQELQYEGHTVYLPPKYFRNPETQKAYISEQENGRIPESEEVQKNEQAFLIEKPPGVLFTPPGAELSKLFERTLGIYFTDVDLQYLMQNMPKLFVEDLEIAQDFEMEIEGDRIRVKMHDSVYNISGVESGESSSEYSTLDFPLVSAIACALAKTTNKPVIVEKVQAGEDGKDVAIEYRTISDEESTEQ
jgi:hypothetical protein